MTRAAGVVLALIVAISCSAPSIAVLRVTRFSGLQAVPAFDRSLQDAAAAQQLYDALVTLPVAIDRWCPYGTGAGYRLAFSDTRRLILVAKVGSDGCREAVLPGNDRRATNESFWAIFANTLALDPRNSDQLFPQPLRATSGTGSRAPALRDRFAPRRL
jgi:hypothetical protein